MNKKTEDTESSIVPQKILVIDDEEDYRQIITMALQMSNYEVLSAANGLDGLAAAQMHHPDLILCDVHMPTMSGHALLTTLREDANLAEIPFIFLTGDTHPSDMRKGMQLGADDYLTKPFSADELLSAVKTRLNKKQLLQKYYTSQFDDIKSNILQSLPHEFRTPLNSVLGFSQMLMEEEGLPVHEIQEMGALIHKSGQRLHHLLENIVLFGQLQFLKNDRKKLEEIRQESISTVQEVIQLAAEKQMLTHDRAGAIQFPANNALVQMSSIWLTKIIEEVVDNALKFSDVGTKVYISIADRESDVAIIIRDEGRGITEEQIKKISAFQQFERDYYEQQGAGLGLAIVKTLVDLHNGTLSFESNEKHGTAVTIRLPKIKED